MDDTRGGLWPKCCDDRLRTTSVERAPMKRRVRPTFLLRLATLIASVAVWALVAVVATSVPLKAFTFIALAVAWLVGVELGVLALLLERAGARAYDEPKAPINSLWFVDADKEDRRERERLREATSGNPSLQ